MLSCKKRRELPKMDRTKMWAGRGSVGARVLCPEEGGEGCREGAREMMESDNCLHVGPSQCECSSSSLS